MIYKVLSATVQPEYAHEYSVAVVVDLQRADGETGDVWVMAGVPDSLIDTAKRCNHTTGLTDVWLYGDSRECWCPDSFKNDDPDAILVACRVAALAAWKAYRGGVR